jgi:hypothetical protein
VQKGDVRQASLPGGEAANHSNTPKAIARDLLPRPRADEEDEPGFPGGHGGGERIEQLPFDLATAAGPVDFPSRGRIQVIEIFEAVVFEERNDQ